MTFVFWHITPKRNSRFDDVTKQTKEQQCKTIKI